MISIGPHNLCPQHAAATDISRSPHLNRALDIDRRISLALDTGRVHGAELVKRNYSFFQAQLKNAWRLYTDGNISSSILAAQRTVASAHFWHPGIFRSPSLEALIGLLADAIPVNDPRVASSTGAQRILHVATNVGPIGGHTRLIWRWIAQDGSRCHSLALTHQFGGIPDRLRAAICNTGGQLYYINHGAGGLTNLIRKLRRAGDDHDLALIHSHTFDVIPFVAFGRTDRTVPAVIVDHIDHQFWPGADLANTVISLRESGLELCNTRRNIAKTRNILLPTPLSIDQPPSSKTSAKASLGLAKDTCVLLTVARPVKYVEFGGVSYAEAHVPILKIHDNAVLITVGPTSTPKWRNAAREVGGRILCLGERADVRNFYAAADIYVDSFPFASNTSLIEAGLQGIPLVSRYPFGREGRILGADLPGFDEHLIRARSVTEYTNVLSRLIEDRDLRYRCGRRTRDSIKRHHVHTKGGDVYNAVFDNVSTHLDKACTPIGQDIPNLSEPDVFIPYLYGSQYLHYSDDDRENFLTELFLREFNVGERLSKWATLVKVGGFHDRSALRALTCLIPESISSRARLWIQEHL